MSIGKPMKIPDELTALKDLHHAAKLLTFELGIHETIRVSEHNGERRVPLGGSYDAQTVLNFVQAIQMADVATDPHIKLEEAQHGRGKNSNPNQGQQT